MQVVRPLNSLGALKVTLEDKMKAKFFICFISILLFSSQLISQSVGTAEVLHDDFKTEAFKHIEYLANLGTRGAGTMNEGKAIEYIKKQFEFAGLNVSIEPFEFDCFVLEKAVMVIANEEFEPTLIGFNPYDGVYNLKGNLLMVDPALPRKELFKLKCDDKILVTTQPSNYFLMAYTNPIAIVFVNADDFKRIKDLDVNNINIEVTGKVKHFQSANVLVSLAPKSGSTEEIIISAHLDSYAGPGADDNGSGVGVLIELAKHFVSSKSGLPCLLKFVAFGAEELGSLGSRAYIRAHRKDLQNCELLFNMDCVGGSEGTYIEMRGGVKNISPEKGKSQIPEQMIRKAARDLQGKWMLLHPSMMISASNVPEWLGEITLSVSKELGYEIKPSWGMGSDHQMFAQSGIVATNIAIAGNKHDCADDIPDKINIESLQKAGSIVANVVLKTMNKF